MADICDMAQSVIDQELERNLKAFRASPLDPGKPGECEICGEWSGRLVLAVCAPCREKYRLH